MAAVIRSWAASTSPIDTTAESVVIDGLQQLVAPSLQCLRAVLDNLLRDLLQDRRVAFCFADRPMEYPAHEDRFFAGVSDSTVVLQTLEDYGALFRIIAQEFAAVHQSRVHLACYISRHGVDRFSSHADDWHVVTLQIAGQKLFTVQDTTIVAVPGMSLVIPRGVVHSTADFGSFPQSVHLSVALHG